MNLLRIKIYQPQAHYRIPFTYQRRHTYPLPPYSTVIGLLINLLGIDDQRNPLFAELKKLKLSIAGYFANKITEYVWFRNLSLKKHVERFGSVENRYTGGHIDHIGGQSPIPIDVLHDVHLIIYVAHENVEFIFHLKNAFNNPQNRLEIIHIGRAEDWIVLEDEPSIVEPGVISFLQRNANYHHFFWIPQKIWLGDTNAKNGFNFDSINGLMYNLTTFWDVVDFDKTYSRHGERNFNYIPAKLNDGLLKGCNFLIDEEQSSPIFLADFKQESE